ncbi:hypothetical protein TNCV_3514391 [Trichonephila clavipes]|nr:hypothetical protein TNCV_3514391 [Trichonephila clavipes]
MIGIEFKASADIGEKFAKLCNPAECHPPVSFPSPHLKKCSLFNDFEERIVMIAKTLQIFIAIYAVGFMQSVPKGLFCERQFMPTSSYGLFVEAVLEIAFSSSKKILTTAGIAHEVIQHKSENQTGIKELSPLQNS